MSGAGNWRELATVKTEGNLAAGLGAGIDFGLTVDNDRLVLNCKASLVFGPGAAGGFGTIVDFEKIYDVAKLLCEALSEVDYRYLFGVAKDAFDYIAYGIYHVIASPGQVAGKAFEKSYEEVFQWWQLRSSLKVEAGNLSENLLRDGSVILDDKSLSVGKIPPQAMGPMLYALSESFLDSWESEQEKAIVLLLTSIVSWHQFVEVLEHMSSKAAKVNAARNLNRLNSILDGRQQDEFNQFIHNLSENPLGNAGDGLVAWTTKNPILKKDILVAAHDSGLFDGIA